MTAPQALATELLQRLAAIGPLAVAYSGGAEGHVCADAAFGNLRGDCPRPSV